MSDIVETCTLYRSFEALTSDLAASRLYGDARRSAFDSVSGQVSGILDALLAMARGGLVSCDIVRSMVAAHDAFAEGLMRLTDEGTPEARDILEVRLLAYVGARNLIHALRLAEQQCGTRKAC